MRSLPFIPAGVPVPQRFVLFAPHPDDIAISMGALAACIALLRVPTTIVLVTDGSEARLPEHVIREVAGDRPRSPEELAQVRGQIRISEAEKEAEILGFPKSSVQRLGRQSWFTRHRTRREHLNADLSLANVSGFCPGEIEDEAIGEIREVIGTGTDVVCAVPDPDDKLTMHRITTEIVNRGRGDARLLTYECLSTTAPSGPQMIFGFGEDLLSVKSDAIRAHWSMKERRKQFGGYSNSGSEFYDVLVRRRNADLARAMNLSDPYAERFGWM